MGIVLPDSILGAPGQGYIREWIIKNHRIIASIDLHADTFQPRNGTQTSVLFLQKKTQTQKDMEEKSGSMADYNIFILTSTFHIPEPDRRSQLTSETYGTAPAAP